MLSFDVRFVTIADVEKIAHFSQFFQGYSLWFFYGKKSTVESVGDRLAEDSLRREKSFDPVLTKIERKLASVEQFELSVFTASSPCKSLNVLASFKAPFHDQSSSPRVGSTDRVPS